MLAHYGYKDGHGDFFIAIDTDKCNGCGDCVKVCPSHVFNVGEDPNDPLNEQQVAFVTEEQRRKLKYACSPCKPSAGYRKEELPCVKSCPYGAIGHSW